MLSELGRLSETEGFTLGFLLDPDEVERRLVDENGIRLDEWGLRFSNQELDSFVRAHDLFGRLTGESPSVEGDVLVAPSDFVPGYYTTIFCDFVRERWLQATASFTFETVMSHPGKLDLLVAAREAGYRTYLYYICTEDVRLNLDRIANRAALGGHAVPPEVVKARYGRSLALASQATCLVDRAYHFDNSGLAPDLIAEFDAGRLVKASANLPNWFVTSVLPSFVQRR